MNPTADTLATLRRDFEAKLIASQAALRDVAKSLETMESDFNALTSHAEAWEVRCERMQCRIDGQNEVINRKRRMIRKMTARPVGANLESKHG